MDFSRIRVLSFDCYGTLVDWASGIEAALLPWLQENEQDKSRDEILAAYVEAEAAVEEARQSASYPDILAETHAALGEHWGLTSRQDQAYAFAATVGTWPLFPDTVAALTALRKRYRLIILSNVDNASFRLTNNALGIEFDAILTAEDIGSYKPALANFRRLVQTVSDWGFRPIELLHVAQSIYHDIEPAHDIGLQTCWIDREDQLSELEDAGKPWPPCDIRFESMAEFAAAALGG